MYCQVGTQLITMSNYDWYPSFSFLAGPNCTQPDPAGSCGETGNWPVLSPLQPVVVSMEALRVSHCLVL